MAEKKLRVFKLREKKEDELVQGLNKLKEELNQVRIAKIAGGTASKLARIRILRKSIAKYLTVINQKARQAVRTKLAKKKYLPLDLRPKKTRALRQKLTKKQANLKVLRTIKKEQNFPLRKYALRN